MFFHVKNLKLLLINTKLLNYNFLRKWVIAKNAKRKIRLNSLEMMMDHLPAWPSVVVLKGQLRDNLTLKEMHEAILLAYVSHPFRVKFKYGLST